MRRSQFATLIGVSKQQVAKYVANGAVVLDGSGNVDVLASLAGLEGRLDEEKRQRAREAFGLLRRSGALEGGPTELSVKAQRDRIERDLKRLQYEREAGQLVSAREVEQSAMTAAAVLVQVLADERDRLAVQICDQFGLDPARAAALSLALEPAVDRAVARFAECLASAALSAAFAARIW